MRDGQVEETGEAEIEALLSCGELQKPTGDAATGEFQLTKASTTVATARSAIETDPDSGQIVRGERLTRARWPDAVSLRSQVSRGASRPSAKAR